LGNVAQVTRWITSVRRTHTHAHTHTCSPAPTYINTAQSKES